MLCMAGAQHNFHLLWSDEKRNGSIIHGSDAEKCLTLNHSLCAPIFLVTEMKDCEHMEKMEPILFIVIQ